MSFVKIFQLISHAINVHFGIRHLCLIVLFNAVSFFATGQLPIQSQQSLTTSIYQLNADQLQRLCDGKHKNLTDSLGLFTNLIKDVPIKNVRFIDSLPYGHYLAVNAKGSGINFRLYHKSFFKVQSFGYNAEVWHIITDQNNRVLKEAKITVKNQDYFYEPDCNCYPIPASRNQETIKITYLDHYDFYKVSSRNFKESAYREETNTYEKSKQSNLRLLPGYVAFNKPLYRGSDTIRVKAFLVNEKGKVWRKRKVLVKYQTPDGKTVVLGKIKRESEGAYVKNFVVPETFPLGQYELSFWKTWDLVKLRQAYFKIEDYTLNPNNVYASRTTQNTYHRGQDVEFVLKAEDVNGLALLDAKAKVTVHANQYLDFYDKSFFWDGSSKSISFEKEVLFDVAGETVVSFDDSLFPNANLNYVATITYQNDLEKLYHQTLSFRFDAKPNHFEFKLKGDSIVVDHFKLGLSSPCHDLQLISMRNNEVISSKTVSAPYREKIDLFNTAYILKNEKGVEIKRVSLNTQNYIPVSVLGDRTHDSIRMKLVNDLQMPVSYQIFKRDKEVAGGQWQKGDPMVVYAAADSSLDDYHVIYSALWRGKHFINEQVFYTDETKLNVEIKQPAIVSPGANIPVEVSISDYRNKPVEGANVTAYSVNDLFGVIPLPSLPYFGRIHHGVLQKFNVSLNQFVFNKNDVLSAEYIEQFKLRKTPYYDFTYPQNGIGIFNDSLEGNMAELAIYGHQMHNRMQILAVYIDDLPVASEAASNRSRYVFSKSTGTYQVKIRTKTHLYTIKNVKLSAGIKTYLCFNNHFIEGNHNVEYLKIDAPPFTAIEWQYAQESYLFLKETRDRYLLKQDNHVIDMLGSTYSTVFYDNRDRYRMIGPLKEGAIKVYNQTKDTTYVFEFYPKYLYSINKVGQIVIDKTMPKRDNAFAYQHKSASSDWNFNYRIPKWTDYFPDSTEQKKDPPKQIVSSKKPQEKLEINYDNPARSQQLKGFRPEVFNLPGAGAVYLKNNTGKIISWTLLVNQNDPKSTGAWYASRFNVRGFSPGIYDMMVLFADSSYALFPNFNILPKGKTYYRIDTADLSAPDPMIQKKYEEIIVAANKAPLSVFSNNPLYYKKIHLKTVKNEEGETMLSGFLVNTYHQPLNHVNLIFEKAGKFKFGALTNRDGYFELEGVEPGIYTVKIGNVLPYTVFENLVVLKGVDNRIVIGNDPSVRINGEGVLETVAVEAQLEEVEISSHSGYSQDYAPSSYSAISPQNLNVSKVNAIPLSAYESNVLKFKLPETKIESTIFPKLNYDEPLFDSQLEAYTEKNQIDQSTLDLIRENDSLNRMRSKFRDYGYWVPNLVTDKAGSARFTVQFPDNITRWKTIVPAMTGQKQAGIGVQYAQAYKPLSGHLGIPPFLICGDSVVLEGKILNYTSTPLTSHTWFRANTDTLKTDLVTTDRTIKDKLWFTWPSPRDSIKVEYGLKMKDGYRDGEDRSVNILTDGIEQIKGDFVELDKDSILTIPADGTKKSIYLYNKPMGIYETEIKKLKAYSFGSNEALASKLKALLLEKELAGKFKRAFHDQKSINTCINLLEQHQKADGSYGWLGDSEYKLWVTTYVLQALDMASKTERVENYMETARFLKSNLSKMSVSDRLSSLTTLSTISYPMNYNAYIEVLDSVNLSLQDQFKLLYLKQQEDSTTSIDLILKSHITVNEGVFWGEQLFDGYINKWSTSALAYKILKRAGGQAQLLKRMRDYFLLYNPEGRTSIERATLLELFLDDEIHENETIAEFIGDVWVNDRKIEIFPHYSVFGANESISIRKAGTRVNVQVNTHTISHQPKGNDSLLTVSTSFRQGNQFTDSLKIGELVSYQVEIEVRETLEYVELKIPIPATFIYASKKAPANSYESSRKIYRHQTVINCAKLPKGSHQFTVYLTPRHEGIFKVIPTQVKEIYFPVNANFSSAKTATVLGSGN